MELIITDKEIQLKKNVSKIRWSITEAIDKVCQEQNYEVTYLEINMALSEVLRSNLGYEMREAVK